MFTTNLSSGCDRRCSMKNPPTAKIPPLDPATDMILFRSLRYSLTTGLHHERGTDLYAKTDPGSPPVFYFRHWLWCDTGYGICEIIAKEEAARFIREQFSLPGFFTGWNHKGIYEILPEVYGKR
jgi:hypothetical protein